jgi:ornithine cyclodeaminase
LFDFTVVPGKHVAELLDGHETEVVDLVRAAYLAHEDGRTVNPDSYFLRFPDKPEARIIALPAYLGTDGAGTDGAGTDESGDAGIAGIKWIGSFPRNIESGLPRASAVLVLNDYTTGYPFALLESAGISAARTAASAALAATVLSRQDVGSVGVVGGGVIARTITTYLRAVGVPLQDVRCHDLSAESAGFLAEHLRTRHGSTVEITDRSTALEADLVVLATTAGTPYITDHEFRPDQVVLNVSLRDLAPELLLGANNIFDDVEHCMKANTSPHLAEQLTGGRDFVTGTLAGVVLGRDSLDPAKPTIFSPFGLGVLDLAVGHYLYRQAKAAGTAVDIPGFFGETSRW